MDLLLLIDQDNLGKHFSFILPIHLKFSSVLEAPCYTVIIMDKTLVSG